MGTAIVLTHQSPERPPRVTPEPRLPTAGSPQMGFAGLHQSPSAWGQAGPAPPGSWVVSSLWLPVDGGEAQMPGTELRCPPVLLSLPFTLGLDQCLREGPTTSLVCGTQSDAE